MSELHGTCRDRCTGVRDTLAFSRDSGAVVDVWGGYADAARTRPWEPDSITNMSSSTKTMTAPCALVLVAAPATADVEGSFDRRSLDLVNAAYDFLALTT